MAQPEAVTPTEVTPVPVVLPDAETAVPVVLPAAETAVPTMPVQETAIIPSPSGEATVVVPAVLTGVPSEPVVLPSHVPTQRAFDLRVGETGQPRLLVMMQMAREFVLSPHNTSGSG